MNQQPILLAITAAAVLLGYTQVSADEPRTFERRASTGAAEFTQAVRSLFAAPPRSRVKPVERVLLNNAVYRYEGDPGMRHDEVSGPVVIFHVNAGSKQIIPGHVYDRK